MSLLCYCRNVDLQVVEELQYARDDLEKHCKQVVFIPYPLDLKPRAKYVLLGKSIVSGLPYSVLLHRSISMTSRAIDIVRSHRIDVVHADTLGLIEGVLEEIDAVKVVNHHNIESDLVLRRAAREHNVLAKAFLYREWARLRKYEKEFCPRYDLNVVVSNRDDRLLRGLKKNINTAIIENGVDCKYFQHEGGDRDSKELIFTGSLDWYPNEEGMFFFCKQVWPLLKKRHRDVRLTIIGRNPSERLVALVAREKDINLKGYVRDVRPYVKEAKVFVCPVRQGGGTRVKILDALAQGIPVVSTPIGCEGLDVTDGGNIMVARDVEEFVRQITVLLSNKDLWNKLSRNGRMLVEKKYSFAVVGKRMNDLYVKLTLDREAK